MKKLISLVTLLQLGSVSASVVAIMDTGVDISHKDLAPKTWVNKNERAGSLVDLDGSGLPGDINGWDFTEGSAKVFNDKYNYLVTDDVKKFYDLYAKYELKTINQLEFTWLQGAVANKTLMGQVDFVGGYSHGTHVGGIAAINNPKAQILSLKILPTVYEEAKAAPVAKTPEQLEFDFAPGITVEEFRQAIIKEAVGQVEEMIGLNGYVGFHKADVVNQSFGIGFAQAVDFIKAGFVEAVKRQPTTQELGLMVGTYFLTFREIGPEMFKAAPNAVFVVAAGNDSSDNDLMPDYPADIQAPNKIVVAATLGYSEIAEFSNFGATKVDVAAPGVAINSTAPTNIQMPLSGTSQAAPFVANVIGLAKDVNPALGPIDLKSIVLKTVDVKVWLKGKVATSGIVNKARVLRAAELSKTMNVEVAIAKARAEVADVVSPKSFNKRRLGMNINYAPVRPSLLVKRIAE